jgi:predicted transcriptional regulator/DNA-binding XRE family transcriptional regulator
MRTILGARIRERRRARGITQAELARRLEISPSYLNLIEHNKRGIAGSLLRRTAEALGLELEDLDGAAERRLLERLEEIACTPDMMALGVEAKSAGELIGRYPGWARAVTALARSEHEATDTARALADRLTHAPFLGESVHRMLTHIASVRSAAEILVDHSGIDARRLRRFLEIIHEESGRLSEVGEALAAYFDKAGSAERVLTPLAEMEALFDARQNRFEEIEEHSESLAEELITGSPGSRQARATELARERLGGIIESLLGDQAQVETVLAREQATDALTDYAAAAILVPMSRFADAAREHGYDVEALAASFSISVETVCMRLSALPPGEGTPRFGYFSANAAGTIVAARNLPGLVTPRYASACPLWVLYRAQQSPETVIRQRTLFPTGTRFVFVARSRHSGGPAGFGKPRHYLTDMLAMSERDAAHTVYAPDSGVPVEAVGSTCLSCPRRDCAHRVADPIAG